MDLLGKIFGNPARVKIMRLFLFHDVTPFTIEEIARRSHVRKDAARKELNLLTKVKMLSKKSFTEKVPTKPTKKKPEGGFRRVKRKGWVLNPKFDLIVPLKNLLIDTELIHSNDLTKRLRQAGTIKLLVLSGLFTRDEHRKLDLLIVGDKVKDAALSKQISIIESEIGRELRYSYFEVDEFTYRMGMYDKLLRDVLENDHTTLINKILL
jgi:hypothetical protein